MTSTDRICFVPGCPSSYQTTPTKVFFPVPSKTNRKQWFEAINQRPQSSKTTLYCCQDHFNLEEDTDNYIKFKVMDGTILKLKRGVVPHIFTRHESPREKSYQVTINEDGQNIDIKEEEVDSDFEDDDVAVKKMRLDTPGKEAVPNPKPQIVEVYVTDMNFVGNPKKVPKLPDAKNMKYKKVRSVGIQVKLRPPHRSVGVMAKLEPDDIYDETPHCVLISEDIKKELFYDEDSEENYELEFSCDASEIKIENTELELSDIKVETDEVEDDGEIS